MIYSEKYMLSLRLIGFFILLKEADLVLGGTASTSNRIKKIDFSTPWLETPIGFLIPYPTSNENIAAIVKPFDLTVITLIHILFYFII